MTLCARPPRTATRRATGATFNNPTGTIAQQRRNLTHVIRTINAMPGYPVSDPAVCDPSPAARRARSGSRSTPPPTWPFAQALVAASRRCVSVQILMNNHLGPQTTPSINYLQNNLGGRSSTGHGAVRRSFAHRCNFGCRGGGRAALEVLPVRLRRHTARPRPIAKTVMVGSSNMTSNASRCSGTTSTPSGATRRSTPVPRHVRPDAARPATSSARSRFADGIYQSTFTPLTPGSADPTLAALNSIHCTGATGGTGLRRPDHRLHQHARLVRGARLRVRHAASARSTTPAAT